MTQEETLKKARALREKDGFPDVPPEALPAWTERDIPMDACRTVRVYEILPSDPAQGPLPLIINFHGGGFVKGHSARDLRYCGFLAERLRCPVWDVDYALAPEAPFPAAVEEACGVTAYAFDHAASLGIDPDRIAWAGHSAGGNLVAAAMIHAARTGTASPRCLLMEYFPADLSVDPIDRLTEAQRADPWLVQRAKVELEYNQFYRRDEDAKNPLCSPLLALDQDLARFPDSLILSAELDSLRDETEAFALRLASCGVTVTLKRILGAPHGFSINRAPGWETALALHTEFLSHHLIME